MSDKDFDLSKYEPGGSGQFPTQPLHPQQLLQLDPMRQLFLQQGALGISPGYVNRMQPPQNTNTSQDEVMKMIPKPLNMFEKAWQNYGKSMKPSDVLDSESVWGAAAQARDSGLNPFAVAAKMANYLWAKMGVKQSISPADVQRHMAQRFVEGWFKQRPSGQSQ